MARNEVINSWSSHVHPDNPNFMQVVRYLHIQTVDGKNSLYWHLSNSAVNDKHFIKDIDLQTARDKYTDKPELELTEELFKDWLKKKQ